MASLKIRLDLLLVERGYASTRERAQALIMAGKVFVNNSLEDKPGMKLLPNVPIFLKEADFPFVSRGALKLEAILVEEKIDVTDWICIDVGASTGGFTDCLRQRGAKKIYAVDVGYGQMAWELRNDNRVIVIERTNIRYMEKNVIPELLDLAVIDTSFISLKIVVPSVLKFLKKNALILALIKPQFEVGKGMFGKGGVVRDSTLHKMVIESLWQFFSDQGLIPQKVLPSPILGPKGNKEFIISLRFPGS